MDSFTDDLNSALPKQMQSEMLDDVRASSLPTNDCAVSNARRIEGRPAITLRPLSERLGRITLKCRTLAIARVNSDDPFRNLSDDILEHILARLPLIPLKAAKKVCKRWASVTSTPEFDSLHNELNHRPHLVLCRIRYLGLSKEQWFAYDVVNNAWVTLPALELQAHNAGSLRGASGVVFAVAGPSEDRLLYKLTSSASSAESFGKTWHETPVMTFPRYNPVVSVALGTSMGHKVVVAGGGDSVKDACRLEHRAVEVFDSEIGTWESYGDLPAESFNISTFFSGVVCDNKFCVLYLDTVKIDKVQIHSLDLYTKQWASIQLECPMDLISSRIMTIGTTLVVAGYCEDETCEHIAVKLWKVDLKTLSLIQIGLMPSKWVALLEVRRETFIELKFLVDGNLVYVSMGYVELLLAEVFLEECKTYWRFLPAVRGLNPSDELITFCASISSA